MDSNAIQPYTGNSRYWSYLGQPIRPLGGSVEDNLFQIGGIKTHLDELTSAGGNYVRCTMSSRDPGDVWPFVQDPQTGVYDLEQPNPVYWGRFRHFLDLTQARGVIVQIEVWDRFDLSRENWQVNPFNPKNNANYAYNESGLAEDYPDHPNDNRQPFFYTVPNCSDNQLLLTHQQRFVDWMLEHSLEYPHVLYCIDNETSGSPEWGAYWAQFIKVKAQAAGVVVYVTEMWDQWDITHEMHNATFDHPELYDFVDISQDNHNSGDRHWDLMQARWQDLAERPRPMNMVKIYGADSNKFGHTDDDGVARFWRGLLGGLATLRFHRPDSGLGLSAKAQANLLAARALLAEWDWLNSLPDSSHALLQDRQPDEAYLSHVPGKQAALYFPRQGSVTVDLRAFQGPLSVKWFDILSGEWSAGEAVSGGQWQTFSTPGSGHWVGLIS